MSSITDEIIYELSVETTRLLNDRQEELREVKWTDGESNLDSGYSKLACKSCIIAWDIIKSRYIEYSGIDIQCAPPDINITFTYPPLLGRDVNLKYKIELKSSINKRMPGSTIKKLNINQPLIYCLRPKNIVGNYKLKCSQYHTAMGNSKIDLFQDRTPRPCINFDKMSYPDSVMPFKNKKKDSWIDHYANCSLKRIDGTISCSNSWQDDMIRRIKKKILDDYIKNTTVEEFCRDKLYLVDHYVSVDKVYTEGK